MGRLAVPEQGAAVADVLIVGGGATGVSAAWAAARQGLRVVLVERSDWAAGTSGRNHGLLHSGARYAVKDPKAAWECWQENQRVRRLFPEVVDPCGGLFVALNDAEVSYLQQLEVALKGLGLPHERLSPQAARHREPELSDAVLAALTVPDASLSPFVWVAQLARLAQAAGAQLLVGWEVKQFARPSQSGGLWQVELARTSGVERGLLRAQTILNAAGPWAAHVAQLAGEKVGLQPMAGALLVYGARPVHRVINRARPPADGDILVPGGPVLVAGTTSRPVGTKPEDLDPPGLRVLPEEVEFLRRAAEQMLPGLAHARLLRAFAGVRPLAAPPTVSSPSATVSPTPAVGETPSHKDAGRQTSRDFQIVMGSDGFFSIMGGKLTTSLLLGEAAARRLASFLGQERSRPDRQPRPAAIGSRRQPAKQTGAATPELERPIQAAAAGPADRDVDTMVCECEWVREGEILSELRASFRRSGFEGARRRLRLGAGPCQGLICSLRLPGLAWVVVRDGKEPIEPGGPAADPVAAVWAQWREFVRRRWWGARLVQDEAGARRAWHEAYLVYTEMMGLPLSAWSPDSGPNLGLAAGSTEGKVSR